VAQRNTVSESDLRRGDASPSAQRRKTNEARSHGAIETARLLHSDLRATREAEAPEALATALTGLASVQPFSGYSLYAARKRLQDAI
jgi:hypothetical protein